MNNIAILGAMWGDEGKGHITHHLSKGFDWVVRFNGGANAGHTIYRDGVKYVHNLLPSVDFRVPTVKSYLGAGMVIDLEQLCLEIEKADKSYPGVGKTIYVDKNAFIVETKHKAEDKAENGHIGSTNRGIGPAYRAKISRKGIRVGDIVDGRVHDPYYEDFIRMMRNSLGVHFVNLLDVRNQMRYDKILYEGAQGILLDINHGIYPYVSCSDCTVSGIYAAGFGFAPPEVVYGVAKAYTTKVGEGPFPTELHGDEAEELRKLGNEYGATTGRPRRVGWLDLPALKYACTVAGITNLILTKFDILDGMKEVPVCVSYGKQVTSSVDFFETQPEYVKLAGWEKSALSSVPLREFISEVTSFTGCEVSYISAGTDTKDILAWR